MTIKDVLEIMIERDASDVFLRAKSPLRGRIYSDVVILDEKELHEDEIAKMLEDVLSEEERKVLVKERSYEFTFFHRDHWRFRAGAFYQRNTLAIVIRKIDLRIATFQELNLPPEVIEGFAEERRGIVLFTGITGSGKSTAIASLIEHMNKYMGRHILAVEEPIEFTFQDKKSIVNQREIGKDVFSYTDALKQFALHSPDVIFIGNIRDAETCYAALTAAETGVLVVSTLHTVNASSTVERIINFFPPHHHHLILNQLSLLLKCVVSLRLIPRSDQKGLVPAYEIMTSSPSISRLLRENKLWELPKYIHDGKIYGMNTFNQCLVRLVKEKQIIPELALEYSDKKEELQLEMRNKGLMK